MVVVAMWVGAVCTGIGETIVEAVATATGDDTSAAEPACETVRGGFPNNPRSSADACELECVLILGAADVSGLRRMCRISLAGSSVVFSFSCFGSFNKRKISFVDELVWSGWRLNKKTLFLEGLTLRSTLIDSSNSFDAWYGE